MASMSSVAEPQVHTTYRLLPKEEWSRLASLSLPGPYPPPELAAAVVAERDGLIAGVLFLQLCAHMEPLYIAPNHGGLVNFRSMVATLESILPSGTAYFVFTPDARVGGMAKAVGMTQLPFRVWTKEVA